MANSRRHDHWSPPPHRPPAHRQRAPPAHRYRTRSPLHHRTRSRSRSPHHDSHCPDSRGIVRLPSDPIPPLRDASIPPGNPIEPAWFHASAFPMHDVLQGLDSASLQLDDYCDPNLLQHLPFPFLGRVPSDRFSLDDHDRFRFYGRQQFREIYDAVKSLKYRGTSRYYLQGTLGSGKSHILAALTCLLMKEGHRVVYLPDCRALALDLFGYLQFALVLAYHGASETQAREYLERCQTIEQLTTFCVKASADHRLLLIIDQANALDPQDEAIDGITLEAKRDARSLLDKITARHLKLASATANYQHGVADQYKQTGERRIHMYGGLTDEEMQYWWKSAVIGAILGHEDRLNIEDLTGKLPILLNVVENLPVKVKDQGVVVDAHDIFELLLGGLLKSNEVVAMQRSIQNFGECQKKKCKNSANISRFRDAWHACIVSGRVSWNMEPYLDWRHFYVRNSKGGVTCGVARRAASDFLRSLGNPEEFLGPQWYGSLKLAGSNMCVLGFFVEQMVLSWMAIRGCGFIETRLDKRPTTVLVGEIPEDVSMRASGVVLYVPTVYNFPAVDAVLVATGPEGTAVVYGIQVTISQTHSNSEEMFLRQWEAWLEQLDLPREKIQFGFVWVLEDRGVKPALENVPEKAVALRHDKKIVHPDFKRLRVTVQEVSPEIGYKLSEARKRALRA